MTPRFEKAKSQVQLVVVSHLHVTSLLLLVGVDDGGSRCQGSCVRVDGGYGVWWPLALPGFTMSWLV